MKNKNVSNLELAEELNKPIIKKFEKRKVFSSFTDNIWGANLAEKHLISKFDKGIRFVLLIFLVNMHGLFL